MKPLRKLVVVAHPDDETLFFGGMITSEPSTKWEVVCITDGGARASERAQELTQACSQLGVHKVHQMGLADIPGQRLDPKAIGEKMKEFQNYDEVYTHGPLGDYGNPHHQDVCLAVHRAFQHIPVWSVANAVFPQKNVTLDSRGFELKNRIMSEIYTQEYERFLLVLPARPVESFARVSLDEVISLYQFLSTGTPLARECLSVYKHLAPLIEAGSVGRSGDAFFAAYFSQQ